MYPCLTRGKQCDSCTGNKRECVVNSVQVDGDGTLVPTVQCQACASGNRRCTRAFMDSNGEITGTFCIVCVLSTTKPEEHLSNRLHRHVSKAKCRRVFRVQQALGQTTMGRKECSVWDGKLCHGTAARQEGTLGSSYSEAREYKAIPTSEHESHELPNIPHTRRSSGGRAKSGGVHRSTAKIRRLANPRSENGFLGATLQGVENSAGNDTLGRGLHPQRPYHVRRPELRR